MSKINEKQIASYMDSAQRALKSAQHSFDADYYTPIQITNPRSWNSLKFNKAISNCELRIANCGFTTR